jgi:calcineurin-like phosphoesterase family protein
LRFCLVHHRTLARGNALDMITPRRLALSLLAVILALLGQDCANAPTPPPAVDPSVADFSLRLQSYVESTKALRQDADRKIPAGKTPEEQAKVLEQRRTMLATSIQAMRSHAKPGDLFTAATTESIRKRIALAFDGPGMDMIRDALEEQNDPAMYKTPSAQIDLNRALSIPAVPGILLQDLPKIPDPIEYRFAGRTLVLADKEAGVVLDYIPGAFPEVPQKAPQERAAPAPDTKTFAYLAMPERVRSVRFAVLGDTGTGDASQAKVAETLWSYYAQGHRFKFILLLGDNLYAGMESARDYERQFTTPYKKFLDARIRFRATLGNHDLATQAAFEPFGMNGHPYYSFTEGNAKFVSLNSNEPSDPAQLAWLDKEFQGENGWRICFFHHPLYSSGVHSQEAVRIRALLENALVKNKVNVVFSGHEHFYERSKPQREIQYFVAGGSAKLRRGDLRPHDFTAFGYDGEQSLMIIEIAGDELFYQALTSSGKTVDCGVVPRTPESQARSAKDSKTQEWIRTCSAAVAWMRGLGTTRATGLFHQGGH